MAKLNPVSSGRTSDAVVALHSAGRDVDVALLRGMCWLTLDQVLISTLGWTSDTLNESNQTLTSSGSLNTEKPMHDGHRGRVCVLFYLGIHRVPFTGSTVKACSLSGGGLGSDCCWSPSGSTGGAGTESKLVDSGDPGASWVPLDDMEQ